MSNNKGFASLVVVLWLGCFVLGSGVGKAINDKSKKKPTPTPTPIVIKKEVSK